jgi:transcriptional regulator with XRE-family HTH domain
MEWTSDKIRQLRRRMGWSQSDLARRLHCESGEVAHLELGDVKPGNSVTPILEMLFNQAELSAYEMTQNCQAEAALNQRALESIDLRSLESESLDKPIKD